MNNKTGIGKFEFIDTVYRDEIPAGEIMASNDDLLRIADPKIRGYYSRTALLGIIAAKQAVANAAITDHDLSDASIISGTTVGGMDRTEIFYKSFRERHSSGRLRNVIGHDCGDSTERIADCLGIKGFLSTINTACSSSANAIMLASRMIKSGKIKRAIAGGVDSLTKFTINGFNSLMILDREQCRPFDENRNGLNLGEGAAFLVLESDEAINIDKRVLGEVTGYGNACDAYHQTASSPDGNGAWLSMKQALEISGLNPENIDYINVHGTGTKNNDLSEGVAIQRIFTKVPHCSSTKSFTGHTLGASGAVEAVISILSIQNNCIFPNLNHSVKMNELNFVPVQELMLNSRVNHVMSNSFGFGGNNSSLIFSRY
jgi:3-oxoacyl-[acyl-carrier-protein] synthase-1